MNISSKVDRTWSAKDLFNFACIQLTSAMKLNAQVDDVALDAEIDSKIIAHFQEFANKGLRVFVALPDFSAGPQPVHGEKIAVDIEKLDQVYASYMEAPFELPAFRYWPTNFLEHGDYVEFAKIAARALQTKLQSVEA